MRRALVAAALALLPLAAAAQEGCWILCEVVVELAGAEAEAALGGWLALPAGATVEHYHEDGFQDTIVRARLEADAAGVKAILAAAGLTAADLAPRSDGGGVPADQPWWDWMGRTDARAAEGSLPSLPYALVVVAPAKGRPGRWTIWLSAFQT